jgi:hypothetical protein
MTPEPDPEGAPCCEPPGGIPRVSTVTTDGRTFDTTAGTGSSANETPVAFCCSPPNAGMVRLHMKKERRVQAMRRVRPRLERAPRL